MSRREAREIAFKLLFQMEIQKDNVDEQINTFLEENALEDKDKSYILNVVKGAYSNVNEIDCDIEKYLKGWKLNRISKVDLTILRLAVYEIYNREDIPDSVSINEAVELAKKYSGEESGAFINGVLAKLYKAKTGEKE